MSKFLLLSLCLIFAYQDLLAINIAFEGLANASQAQISNEKFSYKTDAISDYGGGILFQLQIIPLFGIETGALYCRKTIGYGKTATMTSTWLEVPLLLRFELTSYAFGVGAYYAKALGDIQIKSTIKNREITYKDAYLHDKDFGMTAILEKMFTSLIFSGLRYNQSIKNLSSDGGSFKYIEIQFYLGVRI